MIGDNVVTSDKVFIDAPVSLVWKILVDFENYAKWNSFCPQISAELTIGSPVHMMVDLGNGLQQQVEYITRIEPNGAIVWGMENKPGDPIHALRTQTLSKLSESRCCYFTVDDFSGDAVPDMLSVMAKPVEDGFNLCAYGLKQYAEQLYSTNRD